MRRRKEVRILWNAKDAPWLPSGYGIVGKNMLPRFADRYGKKNVVIYAPVYVRDHNTVWNGMKVLGGQSLDYGESMIQSHWDNEHPTFLLHVGDWFPLRVVPDLAAQDKLLFVAWGPFDFLKLPEAMIQGVLKPAWRVVPWNEYSKAKFIEYGLKNVTNPIPLGVNTKIFYPVNRHEYPNTMRSLGFREDTYNILIAGANQRRKYWYEQLEGVSLFRKFYPDIPIRVYFHTHTSGDMDVQAVVHECGLNDLVIYPDQYTMSQGGMSEQQLNLIINCADVVLNCCLEGVGLWQLQAQASGVPVITMAEGPGPEYVSFGAEAAAMGVDYTQLGTKPIPDPVTVARALEHIYQWRGQRDTSAIDKTRVNFSWDKVAEKWFDLIENTLMPERDKHCLYVAPPSRRIKALGSSVMEID